MKPLNWVAAAGIVLIAVTLFFVAPFNQKLYSSEKHQAFAQILSTGDRVCLDTFAGGTRIVVAPDEAYWQASQGLEEPHDRGVVTGVYDGYVTIRIANQGIVDPLTPQDKVRIVHLPISAISRIVTFTE